MAKKARTGGLAIMAKAAKKDKLTKTVKIDERAECPEPQTSQNSQSAA